MVRAALLIVVLAAAAPAWAGGWRGYVATEYRGFAHPGLDADQHRGYPSVAGQAEYHVEWDGGRQALTATPFYRWDRYDERRTHGDMRELLWLYVGRGFESRVGIGKVFWGVTETQRLVDVVNQIDLVENPDRKEKLGQPMLNLTGLTSWGTWELYLLPVFRERTFPGEPGRLRTLSRVDTREGALYESARGDRHIDAAVRWTRDIDAWDVSLSHFYGTNREPRFVPALDRNGEPVLRPYYELLHQSGLEVQATLSRWLLKLEAVRRTSRDDTYGALTAGFEYTLSGVLDSPMDVGLLMEYLHDGRGPNALTPYEDDVMLGVRLTPNDAPSTQLLVSAVVDRRSTSRAYSIEASRRLTPHITVAVEARAFRASGPADPLYSLRRDDYAQLKLAYYF